MKASFRKVDDDQALGMRPARLANAVAMILAKLVSAARARFPNPSFIKA